MPVIEYKCPSCGSGMTFDSTTGKLSCPSCGRKDNIEQIPDPLKQEVLRRTRSGNTIAKAAAR
ncbi:hypothetical protein HMSSN139_24000 [Paenibacillus sp. HMSSN-139]|nr:hypothetical protein HMSSN139_24000 [Paenibacillus sp. HMSSN-139]